MANQRRNNPAEMTIYEQLEKIKEEVCDRYCTYTSENRNGLLGDYFLEEICNHCPLNKL